MVVVVHLFICCSHVPPRSPGVYFPLCRPVAVFEQPIRVIFLQTGLHAPGFAAGITVTCCKSLKKTKYDQEKKKKSAVVMKRFP